MFLRKPLGDRQFRAFAVREDDGCDGRVRLERPARRFAFWKSEEQIQDLNP